MYIVFNKLTDYLRFHNICNIFWQINEIAQTYEKKRCEDPHDYGTFVRYLMALVLFKHYQRPSVATNMLVREYSTATLSPDGRDYIVPVSEHKTASKGPAIVVLEASKYKLYGLYLKR